MLAIQEVGRGGAKRGLDTLFFATPNDHDGDAVPTGAGDHG
jgi:hypothetical protein